MTWASVESRRQAAPHWAGWVLGDLAAKLNLAWRAQGYGDDVAGLETRLGAVLGDAGDPATERRRRFLVADWVARVALPEWLDAAELGPEAATLRRCDAVCDRVTCDAVLAALREIAKTVSRRRAEAVERTKEEIRSSLPRSEPAVVSMGTLATHHAMEFLLRDVAAAALSAPGAICAAASGPAAEVGTELEGLEYLDGDAAEVEAETLKTKATEAKAEAAGVFAFDQVTSEAHQTMTDLVAVLTAEDSRGGFGPVVAVAAKASSEALEALEADADASWHLPLHAAILECARTCVGEPAIRRMEALAARQRRAVLALLDSIIAIGTRSGVEG